MITDAAVLLANFATLGSTSVVAKFYPFYQKHLPASRNDLPAITGAVFLAGMSATLILLQVFEPQILRLFGRNNPLFAPFYYTLSLFVCLQGCFLFLEIYAWFAGKTILSNALKELLFRLLTTAILVLYGLQIISFGQFMSFFGMIYLPAVLILLLVVAVKTMPLTLTVSRLSRRLKFKMMSLGGFFFLTSVSNIGFIVCDTLFLASMYNFSQAGIYAVAQYFSQVLEVPMRSMQSGSVPVISEYWRAKNMEGLLSIYRKSCINLLIPGMALGGLIIVNLPNLERFFPPAYQVMLLPTAILIVSRWVNLGTGLNTMLIQLSTYWRFDFASTLVYSILGIPLNYLLINRYGMTGAAIASLIAMVIYNGIRFVFLWKKFGLQPFGWNNLFIAVGGLCIIGMIWMLPLQNNLYLDAAMRSALFLALFSAFIIYFRLSAEVVTLWNHWRRKLFS